MRIRRSIYYLLATALLALLTSLPAAAVRDAFVESKHEIEIWWLRKGASPIWMGPEIRYTVYEKTKVEARVYGLTGELIVIYRIGDQEPGQYTVPFDGTMDGGPVIFDGKYQFELYFGDEYACTFWFICRPLGRPFSDV